MGTWCLLGITTPRVGGSLGPPGAVGFLLAAEGWPETGLAQLVLTFWHDGPQVPFHVGDEVFHEAPGARAMWQGRMDALPRRRFMRNSRSLRAELRGDPALDSIAELHWSELTHDQLHHGARRVAQALENVAGRLAPRDGVDLSELTQRAWALTERTWPDEAAPRSDLVAAHALDRARITVRSPGHRNPAGPGPDRP